jgi:hypothetical protein
VSETNRELGAEELLDFIRLGGFRSKKKVRIWNLLSTNLPAGRQATIYHLPNWHISTDSVILIWNYLEVL